MVLVELSPVPDTELPVAALRDHLRLGTGFADDGTEDGLLETCLRSALATIEARTGKVLLSRPYRWSLTAWRDLARQTLPVAPVSAITALRIVDAGGGATVAAPESYTLVPDAHRPQLKARGLILPSIPVDGTAEIDFEAGYGPTWGEVPANIAQAVVHLAAYLYEHRLDIQAAPVALPAAVTHLIEPYRVMRLFGGRGA
ncbi:MAG: hypothetical protein QNJ13_06865 [Paracoccaceae bacterium]|nr:hypothetical protein [Paracoccaceae bacterium]